jgi:hypothetical protein
VAVKTDGAGAYAGIVFTVGLSMMSELVEICVTDHYIGESGKNKSQLDGQFGVKGAKLRRLVAAALQDVLSPEMLFQGMKQTLGRNEVAQRFQPDRSHGSTLDATSIQHLASMSHRAYEYAADGSFAALSLRQQTNLGAGLRVEAAKLRKAGSTAFSFAKPKLLDEAGSCCAPIFDASGARLPDRSVAAACDSAKAISRTDALPIARTDAGREQIERLRAQKREQRQVKQQQQAEAARACEVARCQQSSGFWCMADQAGCRTCNFTCGTAAALQEHIAKGQHREGAVRPYACGVSAGRGSARARDVQAVQQVRARPHLSRAAARAAAVVVVVVDRMPRRLVPYGRRKQLPRECTQHVPPRGAHSRSVHRVAGAHVRHADQHADSRDCCCDARTSRRIRSDVCGREAVPLPACG